MTVTAFSNDGTIAAIASMDGTISLFDCDSDPETGKLSLHWFEDISDGPCDIELVRWHPKGLGLLVGCRDSTVWLYSVKERPKKAKKKRVKVLSVLSGHIGPVLCGNFTANGKHAYTGSEDGSLLVWNCRSGEAMHHLKGGKSSLFHVSAVTAADDQRGSHVLATGSADCQVVLTNYRTGKWLAILGEQSRLWHTDGVETLHFCPLLSHCDYLCSGALDGLIKVWDLNRHDRPRVEFTNDGSVLTTQWFHHSPLIATGLMTGMLTVWDTRDATPVKRWTAHRAGIHALDISKDDRFLVSSSDDGTCKVFAM